MMIFGISGSTDGVNFAPVAALTGFNAMGVVRNNGGIPFNIGLLPYNATMDNGTNYNQGNVGANTWFEKGWDTYHFTNGFPVHGSTLVSSNTGRPYQLAASYAQPMSALCDTNHQLSNITPSSPQSYTAFSLLVSGGNIGAANTMSNILIFQHDDGSQETNIFFCFDWFNNNNSTSQGSVPAFSANGRADFSPTRTYNSDPNAPNGDPKLYESQFIMQNSRSPVTNIILKYFNPGSNYGTAWTTFIYGVSATAGGIPLTTGSNTLAQNVYSGGTASFLDAVIAGLDRNSTPHFQWQYSATEYGAYANLTDGVNGVSGSTTSNLVITAVSGVNVGYYQCVATNTVSTNICAAAPLTLLVSTATNIAQVGDPITSFGSPNLSPAGQDATKLMDGTLAKYLNYGSGASNLLAPFLGPVGYTTSPNAGSTVITAMRFIVASDAPERDPVDYELDGSNDGGTTWTLISSNFLALSDVRNENLTDPIDLRDQVLQEVDFANSTGYTSYKVTFQNVKTNGIANSMQISEVQLLGGLSPLPPGILTQPSGAQKLFVGETFLASVTVTGPSPYTYYWYRGATLLPSQTASVLTLNNVQLSDSGAYSCTISNIYGTTNSTSEALTVLARPAGYASTILADNPIAYWRLDEGPDDANGNDGTIANDYVGSHNGKYTNVVLGVPGYNPPIDPDTAVAFGQRPNTNPAYVGGVTGINFQSPTNVPKAFSIEAWMQGVTVQADDAGIVSLGIGGGGEQFNLDAGGTAHAMRFFFRDAAGNTHPIITSISTSDNQWHHLIVTVDEVNSNMFFYHNGLVVGSNALTGNLGILTENSPTNLFYIGSRPASTASIYPPTNLFQGNIDEVAIYNYSLSAAQAQAHFFGAELPPTITLQPTNVTVSEGTTATFNAAAYGAPTLAYQWWNSGGSTPTTPLSGQTSPTLTFNNAGPGLSGNFYQLVVSNNFGAVTSAVAQLTVVSGPPQILGGGDLQSTYFLYADTPMVLPVTVGGTQPFTYGWSYNGAPMSNGGRVSGANTATLTVNPIEVVDSGTYQLFITNGNGVGQSTLATVTVVPSLSFNGAGVSWTANGNGTGVNGYVNGTNNVTLTDGGTAEAFSSFFSTPVYIGGFKASFTYQDVNLGGADGATFCVQNDPRGAAARGPDGGGLGYGINTGDTSTTPITPSVALALNLYTDGAGPGIAISTNGNTGSAGGTLTYTAPGAIALGSGDPINISLIYLNGAVSLSMTDTVSLATFNTTVPVNIPAVVGGNTAYVGFTGATGGVASQQVITNFTFVSIPPVAITHTANTVTLAWPLSSGGYQVQSTPSINPTTWTTLTNIPSAVGGNNQVTLTVAPGATFYRLVNP